jgi:hypothetical protein
MHADARGAAHRAVPAALRLPVGRPRASEGVRAAAERDARAAAAPERGLGDARDREVAPWFLPLGAHANLPRLRLILRLLHRRRGLLLARRLWRRLRPAARRLAALRRRLQPGAVGGERNVLDAPLCAPRRRGHSRDAEDAEALPVPRDAGGALPGAGTARIHCALQIRESAAQRLRRHARRPRRGDCQRERGAGSTASSSSPPTMARRRRAAAARRAARTGRIAEGSAARGRAGCAR